MCRFVLLLAAALELPFPASAQLPSIKLHGIVNAASFFAAGLPGGSIARGSIFTIFGGALGPAQGTQVSSFPLGNTFSGVSITVTQAGNVVNALPLFVRQDQINAVMPSNAPLGWVSVQVTYNNARSNPAPAYVVNDSAGIFTSIGTGLGPGAIHNFVTAASQPANSTANSAKPGQVVTLFATGLGPITSPDNQAPPAGTLPTPVEVWVGGVPASVSYSGRSPCCSGLDQVIFTVPSAAPQGCWVPVEIRTSHATVSNFVSMAVDPKGAPCSDPSNPFSRAIVNGGSFGLLTLLRMAVHEDLGVNSAIDVTEDFVTMTATNQPGGAFAFAPFAGTPPPGSCTVYPGSGDFFEGGNVPQVAPPALDPGKQFQVSGPGSSQSVTLQYSAAPLGSYLPLYSLPNLLFLAPGKYAVSSTGGANVGPFNASVTVPSPLTWTNRDQTTIVSRSQSLTLEWSPGAANQTVTILGIDSDLPTNSSALFLCTAPVGATSFSVPPEVLAAIPATQPSLLHSKSVIYVISSNDSTFAASGLNAAHADAVFMSGKTVSFE